MIRSAGGNVDAGGRKNFYKNGSGVPDGGLHEEKRLHFVG